SSRDHPAVGVDRRPPHHLEPVAVDEVAFAVEAEAAGPGVEALLPALNDEVTVALDHQVRVAAGGLDGALGEDPVDGGDLGAEAYLDRIGAADDTASGSGSAHRLGQGLLESDL